MFSAGSGSSLTGVTGGYRIAFCGKDFPDHKLTGNYLETLKILGVDEKRLLFIEKPTRAAKILIPEASYGDGKPYSDIYVRGSYKGLKKKRWAWSLSEDSRQ